MPYSKVIHLLYSRLLINVATTMGLTAEGHMRQSRTLAWLAAAGSLCLTACVNPGIVEVSPDQYLLARRDPGGMVGNSAALKARMIEEAKIGRAHV